MMMSATLELAENLVLYTLHNTVHPSFLASILPESLRNFSSLTNSRLRFKIQVFLLKALQVQPISANLVGHPYWPLLNISAAQWQSLKMVLGSLYFLEAVKKIISYGEKAELLRFLTRKWYKFVIYQGNLYAPTLRQIRVPEGTDDLLQEIQGAGHYLLEYLWAQQPEVFVRRFIIKMDRVTVWNFRHIIHPIHQHQLFVLCVRLLKKMED